MPTGRSRAAARSDPGAGRRSGISKPGIRGSRDVFASGTGGALGHHHGGRAVARLSAMPAGTRGRLLAM